MGKRVSQKSNAIMEMNMSAMIDVVFQLLIFFMLTLKISPAEGDFNINMPLGAQMGGGSGQQEVQQDIKMPPIKVRLIANADGTLAGLQMGQRQLGNDHLAFDRLNAEIGKLVGRRDNPFADELEVEIDADYNLQYRHVISAVSASTGYISPQTGKPVRFVDKVKFAPPRRPAS